jgi:hypothetical protein
MRFPMEFVYEVCVQCLTGFVIGALYTNFTFHDIQQVFKTSFQIAHFLNSLSPTIPYHSLFDGDHVIEFSFFFQMLFV